MPHLQVIISNSSLAVPKCPKHPTVTPSIAITKHIQQDIQALVLTKHSHHQAYPTSSSKHIQASKNVRTSSTVRPSLVIFPRDRCLASPWASNRLFSSSRLWIPARFIRAVRIRAFFS